MTKHNFSAGPAILDQSVIDLSAQAVKDIDGSGLSILEISHRSPAFKAILAEARSLVSELLGLSEEYEVLYLTGGASSQFFMVPMNLLGDSETAGYIDTGSWSTKAIKEAKLFGNVNVLASSEDKNFNYIPDVTHIPEDLKYLHVTSNNTIYGTQYKSMPEGNVPLVADMSSDIFNAPIKDIERYGVIYAGAQKNLGPAGTTLVIVRKDMLGTVERAIPTMLDYRTHIKKDSAFNTPPVFPIYACLLSLRWLKSMGGPAVMETRNAKKAQLLYNEIDRNSLFEGLVRERDRSNMNATFVIKDDSLEDAFMDYVSENDVVGLKGHRSVGGFRASIYNAMPIASVAHLVELMQTFEEKHG